MLQEVHCSEKTNPLWSAEWGYKTIFGGNASNQGGVAMLFNNSFAFNINKLLLFDLSPSLVIGLKPQPLKNKYHYFSLLVVRFYIWTCRIRGQCPKIEGFPPFLSHYNLSINTV